MHKSALLSVLVLGISVTFTAAPAFADSTVLYDNSTSNSYQGNGYYVGPGYSMTDSFALSSNSTITGISLGVELYPMDPVSEVDWQITTSAFGGTVIDSGAATTLTEDDFASPIFGESFPAQVTFDIDNPDLSAGIYYLEIDNIAGSINGNPVSVFWDTSSGPSTGQASYYSGSQPSETFQILGTEDTATPEPSSFLLLGSGLAGLAGLLKRKLTA